MKDEKENITLVDRVAIVVKVCIWRGLPAVRKTLEHDSGDMKDL